MDTTTDKEHPFVRTFWKDNGESMDPRGPLEVLYVDRTYGGISLIFAVVSLHTDNVWQLPLHQLMHQYIQVEEEDVPLLMLGEV